MDADTLEHRARRAVDWAGTDDGAQWAFRVALAVSALVFFVVGRRQWFIRDDWAFLISRNVLRDQFGNDEWLLTAQDGHWMTPPILVYRGIQNLVGIDSYWPYLLPTLALHVGIVFAVRELCRRIGMSPWTTTIVCSMLLVFGGGWENIVFAIQITYNLSLAAFLVQVLLVDHDGPPDRRDAFGAVVGVIGVASSGFGPFFIVGLTVLLGLRRRWKALVIAVAPQALAYVWWYVTWQSDLIADRTPGPRSQVPAFLARGVEATFASLLGLPTLAGAGIVAALAITVWRGGGWRTQTTLVTMWVTVAVMFLGVGLQRIGFGVSSAGASRYQYMTAMMLAPAVGLAVDQIRRWSAPGLSAVRGILVVAVVLNAGWLQGLGTEWADRARNGRTTFELVAGSPLTATADPSRAPDPYSPDVTVRWLPWLVEHGAITPRTPVTPDEVARVRVALGLDPAPAPASAPAP